MNILIGGGGTGGHIYPALALARYARKIDPDSRILFVGSAAGMESRIVPAAGFQLQTIPASGFKRTVKGLGRTMTDLFAGIREAAGIIDRFKPQVIFGTGGYVAGPLMIAGVIKRFPVVIHEQNAIPGMTNRWITPFVKKVCLSFAETAERLPSRSKTIFTGNPRAAEVQAVSREEGCRQFGFDAEDQIILVYGGSRGAQQLNQVVSDYLAAGLLPETLKMIYITGDIYYDEIRTKLPDLPDQVRLLPYLENMPVALAAADLALTRSGATTLAEITALGVPAILIPSPNVVNNHQYYNARILADRDAAVLIEEKDFNRQRLQNELSRLFKDRQIIQAMAKNSRQLGVPDAAERVYQVLREVIQ